MKKILFVCTGNICRSSAAEAVLRHIANQEGAEADFNVQSAGTHGYHIGEAPDSRGIATAKARGYSMKGMKAQKLMAEHFHEFDEMIAMDAGHMEIIKSMRPNDAKANISTFMDYCDSTTLTDVPDPYYGDQQGFEDVLDIVEEGCTGIYKQMK